MCQRARYKSSRLHDADDAAFVAQQVDPAQGISVDDEKIGLFVRCDRSYLILNADQTRGRRC